MNKLMRFKVSQLLQTRLIIHAKPRFICVECNDAAVIEVLIFLHEDDWSVFKFSVFKKSKVVLWDTNVSYAQCTVGFTFKSTGRVFLEFSGSSVDVAYRA